MDRRQRCTSPLNRKEITIRYGIKITTETTKIIGAITIIKKINAT
jgi:hypothetical protein